MANIKLDELTPSGAELFLDSESFLQDLKEQETGGIVGGRFCEYCQPTLYITRLYD